MSRTEPATVSRIVAALVAFVLAGALACAPALAAGRGWGPNAKAQAAAAATGDDEQRGVIIPDLPPRPPSDRDDDNDRDTDRGGGSDLSPPARSTGGGSHAESVPVRATAKPGLPETGGGDALMLVWFGSLLLGAGYALRYALD